MLLFKQFQVYLIYTNIYFTYLYILLIKNYIKKVQKKKIIIIICVYIEDETSDNSCGVRQFAKISFNDKDLLGRLSGKKNTDVTERIVTGKGSNKSDSTKYSFNIA